MNSTITARPFSGQQLHSRVATPCPHRRQRTAVAPQAGFIGSPTNLIIVATTTAFLAAGRFGLAPTANRQSTPSFELKENNDGNSFTSDPAGLTAVDLLALGTLGHVAGVGIVLGLKYAGTIP